VNIFYGNNGSGKTTILESLHMLAMARSFRGGGAKSLITHEEQSCTVFGALHAGVQTQSVSDSVKRAQTTIGVQRQQGGEVQIKVAGQVIRRVAELAELLPVQVINAQSFELLTGAPASRRRYLDWGVFHVEHRFYAEWQVFQRCIKQRNELLRRGKISQEEWGVWTQNLADSGELVNDYRYRYFEALLPRVKEVLANLLPALADGIALHYRRGWDSSATYAEALSKSQETDSQQGYTHVGPQRADIRVFANGRSAAETLSRGQQKLLICALKLAQGQLLAERSAGRCFLYLVDDLTSELDEQHSQYVCEALSRMGAQVFITCVDGTEIKDIWPSTDQVAMFHVEHGAVTVD
jgi:DNA replication and repair protein RecF